MIRKAATVVVVLCLSSVSLHAESTKLTVSATSASVYKSPSVGSPVIGKAARGTSLEVAREVGDWVKVSWPDAPDGFGYVRSTMGSISRNGTVTQARANASPASKTATGAKTASAPAAAKAAPVTATQAPRPLTQQPAQPTAIRASAPSPVIQPPTHTLGFGGRMGGSTFGVGGSVRGWSQRRIGAQFEVSHYSMTSPIQIGSFSATQFGPSVLFGMKDNITDHVWMRPYFGAGVDWTHASLTGAIPGVAESSNKMGMRVFGGSEFMFANAPQFGLSLDIGYYKMPTPFVGWEMNGVGAAVSAHWYVK
jgi:hypothetical protein